jgi:glycosyltransferase involved in cell wall biosynthesis
VPESAAPRVSILLPTHNRADVLPFAIRSALAQTWTDFELLIVGDGCTHQTATVVQSFDDGRIRWFDLPKAPGVGYANRNVALRQARGEIVAYLAHDDLWFPDHLALLVNCLLENKADFAYSLPLFISTRGHPEPMVFNLHDPHTWKLWRDRRLSYLILACVVHRRACLDQFGYWSETLRAAGDWELWLRLVRQEPAPNFAYLPVPTTLHFVAAWRRYRETRPRAWWRWLRAQEGSAQPALKLDISAGDSEQAAAWSALSRDPAGCVWAVRHALQVDLDRRGAFRLTLSDLLEAGRRGYRQLRQKPRDWSDFSPPDTTSK